MIRVGIKKMHRGLELARESWPFPAGSGFLVWEPAGDDDKRWAELVTTVV